MATLTITKNEELTQMILLGKMIPTDDLNIIFDDIEKLDIYKSNQESICCNIEESCDANAEVLFNLIKVDCLRISLGSTVVYQVLPETVAVYTSKDSHNIITAQLKLLE